MVADLDHSPPPSHHPHWTGQWEDLPPNTPHHPHTFIFALHSLPHHLLPPHHQLLQQLPPAAVVLPPPHLQTGHLVGQDGGWAWPWFRHEAVGGCSQVSRTPTTYHFPPLPTTTHTPLPPPPPHCYHLYHHPTHPHCTHDPQLPHPWMETDRQTETETDRRIGQDRQYHHYWWVDGTVWVVVPLPLLPKHLPPFLPNSPPPPTPLTG